MKIGDQVQLYVLNQPDITFNGIVIAADGKSIAVAVQQQSGDAIVCAHRQGPYAPWIDVETGQPLQIV